MCIATICQEAVDVVLPGDTAYQAAERMHQRTVGALVVVDRDNEPIGIVTDRDLMIRVLAAGRDPHTTTVREVMTAPVKTIEITGKITDALATMRGGAFRRLPVVDELGRLVGIVALDDILIHFVGQLQNVGQLLEKETPRAAALAR